MQGPGTMLFLMFEYFLNHEYFLIGEILHREGRGWPGNGESPPK